MGQLLADDGHGDGHAGGDGLVEGGAEAQAVDEVVEAVAKDDHPGHRLHRRVTALEVHHALMDVALLRLLPSPGPAQHINIVRIREN